MKKGYFIGTHNGKKYYFIAYSNMTYNGKPLLLCHTDPTAPPRMCGQYTENFFTREAQA